MTKEEKRKWRENKVDKTKNKNGKEWRKKGGMKRRVEKSGRKG